MLRELNILRGILSLCIAESDLRRMPDNRNDLQHFTLGFMLEVAAHYHDDHAMFAIVADEYPSPLEYKAYVKRFTSKDVTTVKRFTSKDVTAVIKYP